MVRGKDNPHRPARLTVRAMAAAVALATVLPAALPALGADFAKGVSAYDSGDYQTALQEWLPLAEDGDPAAQRNIGHLYRRGLGVEQSQAQAIKWYREAAERGFDRAQANLAYMYLNGDGVDRDFALAAEWFYRAAIQGHPIAQFNLGQMYQLGWGVPKDRGRAMAWYNLAAKAGHQKALDRLSVLILRAGPPELEEEGGESLPAGIPEGEPGWEEDPMRVADTAPESSQPTAAIPPPNMTTAAAEGSTPTRDPTQALEPAQKRVQVPVPRIQEPLPQDKQVAVATLAPPPMEPVEPATTAAEETAPADEPAPTATNDVAEEDDGGGFFSRFFSLRARDNKRDIAGPRESQLGATLPKSPAADDEPDVAAASQPSEEPPQSTLTSEQPAQAQNTVTADEEEAVVTAEKAHTPKPAQSSKSWVNPDTQSAATNAPDVANPNETEEPAAKPARPEIKITMINPPLEEDVAAPSAPPEKKKRGFFARLFGIPDDVSEAATDAQAMAESENAPVQAQEPVTDLTALPEDTDPTDPAAADLAPKVKGVKIAVLEPPPADKIVPSSATDVDKPVQAVIRQSVPAVEPLIPIPEPATGPTEQEAKHVVAQKTASAGQPRQRADDNPQEFFAPKVTIDWNTVLKPSASYSPPAPANNTDATGKDKKPKSLADSDQATLTALAAQQGLIEPLQLGLLAYRSKDYNTAIKYWLPMAHSGKSRAQFYMGGLYHDGTGVEQNKVQAFMWWSLAAAKGYNPALTARERLRDRMSEVEVAEAINLVRTWRPIDE